MKSGKGVALDFVIHSRALTKEEEGAISQYIIAYKAQQMKESTSMRKVAKRVKGTKVLV